MAGPIEKTCCACGVIKPLTDFYKRSVARDGVMAHCKTCQEQRTKASRTKRAQEHPDEVLAYYRRHGRKRRGVALEDLELAERMSVELAGTPCWICHAAPGEVVDHDHLTGRVRGWLCTNCNHGLGKFKDNVEFLVSAIDYLRREA